MIMLSAKTVVPIFFRLRRVARLFVAVCLAGSTVMGARVLAGEQPDGTGKPAAIAFDIAPQPLEAALDAFSSTSNVQVLYETSLTAGRRSTKIQGLLTPEAALNVLLAGTGLTAWRTTMDSYSLVPRQDTSQDVGDIGHPPPEIAKYGHFLGGVQAVFVDALCRNPVTRPGRYKIALKFTIGPSGGVMRTSLLNSTGNPERDAEVIATVEHLTVGEAPPLQLPQPITMVIAPRSPNVTGDCASSDGMRANR